MDGWIVFQVFHHNKIKPVTIVKLKKDLKLFLIQIKSIFLWVYLFLLIENTSAVALYTSFDTWMKSF